MQPVRAKAPNLKQPIHRFDSHSIPFVEPGTFLIAKELERERGCNYEGQGAGR